MATTPASAHAFVDDLAAPALRGDDDHHLRRVLRLPPGAPVTVGDGRGSWRRGRLTTRPAVEIDGEIVRDPAPSPAIGVAFALVKGQRPELVVQKLTELGVDRILPFAAARSVVRWDEAKAHRHAARFAEVARQAAMQCRRTWLPQVAPLAGFAEVADLPDAVLADVDGAPPRLDRTTVLVGPEGGWSAEERGRGLPTVALGDHVLRAETAAIAAGVVFAALRGGLVRPAY